MYQNVQSFLSGIKYIVLEQEIHCFNMQIPEAVNKLPLSTHFGNSCKTGWNKDDSSYYSEQSSKVYERVKF